MTLRLNIGIDPGATGAVSEVADGQFVGVYDLPQRERKTKGRELDGRALAEIVRDILRRHPGAATMVTREHVQPMPSRDGGRSMGASSAFYYGAGVGKIDGVVECLGLPLGLAHASTWKKRMGLSGSEKDYSRTAAVQMFPEAAPHLKRVKDHGRADAILIAAWAYLTEQLPPVVGIPASEDPFASAPGVSAAGEPPEARS